MVVALKQPAISSAALWPGQSDVRAEAASQAAADR